MTDFPTPHQWQPTASPPAPPPLTELTDLSPAARSTSTPPGPAALPPPPPPGSEHPPRPTAYSPPQKTFWTGGKIAALVVFVALSLVAVGVVAFVAFGALSATVVDESVPTDARVGECYERWSLEPVDCSAPHHYEVYSQIVYDFDAEYPGRLDRLLGAEVCEDDFEAYTGENYLPSALDYSIPLPSREEWDAGDRTTVCALHHGELKPIVGTRAR